MLERPGERRLSLLLAARRWFQGQPLSAAFAKALGRAGRDDREAGELAQVRRPFRVRPAQSWPSAALIEGLSQRPSDVTPFRWLRADPVWLQADLSTARLMAWGNLRLTADEAAALMKPLKPLFGDSGFVLEAREPESWVVQCARETRLPDFPHPLDALGDDAFPHLPSGPDARRWRALLGEAQVLLHQNPINAERLRSGLPPANSLWFWGGGVWPDQVDSAFAAVATADPELAAYANASGASVGVAVDAARPGLIDLRAERRWSSVDDLVQLALAALHGGTLDAVELDFGDGHGVRFERGQRWRFWKRPARDLGA